MTATAPFTHALAVHTVRLWYEWHCALGHINKGQLMDMHCKGYVIGMDVDLKSTQDFDCEACIQAKQSRLPFSAISADRNYQLGELVFSDIWGPARLESLNHNIYVITFTDVGTRYVIVFFMKSRAAALDCFKKFEKLLETQRNAIIKTLQVNNAKEYVEGEFKTYLESRSIVLRTTAPYSLAQNGVAERLNRTLVERACAMLFAYDNIPRFLWEEAISYATYLKNRMPTRALQGSTLYKTFWGRKPNVSALQEFGTPC